MQTIIGSTHSGNSDFFFNSLHHGLNIIFFFFFFAFQIKQTFSGVQGTSPPCVGFVQVIHPSHDQLLSEG